MIISGCDWSLTSPAITTSISGEYFYHFYHNKEIEHNRFNTLYHSYYSNSQERYENLVNCAIEILKESDLIVIEDYSMGSHGKVFDIAECTGLLKYKLWKLNKQFIVVSPKTIKKFATGNGNADKHKMVDSFITSTNINIYDLFKYNKTKTIKKPISDIADSYWLCKYGEHAHEIS